MTRAAIFRIALSRRALSRRAVGRSAAVALAALVQPGPSSAETPVLVPHVRNAASTPAPDVVSIHGEGAVERLTLPVGKSIIVDLPDDAAELFVGRPEVANATVRTPRRIYVMAVARGPTTIFALTKSGRPIATLEINVIGRDIGALAGILKTALPDNDIRVQGVDDTIILTGTVASAVDAQRAYDIASAFTGYTAVGSGGSTGGGSGTSVSFSGQPIIVNGSIINSLVIRGQDQVTLKVQLVEVQRNVVKQLGIQLSGALGAAGTGGLSSTVGSAAYPTIANTFSSGNSTAGGLSSSVNWTGQRNSLASSIQAYERTGVAHVLAEPNITAISGETASLSAGGTLPLSTSSTIDPATGRCTVSYTQQNYGVSLAFTPTVLSEGRISMHIVTTVTEPDPTTAATSACSNQVGFRTRSNTTTVELPSGGSIVTAGLVQQASQQAIAGTPGLMNLPILGALFRSRDYQRQESELMIVVTPYLAKTLRPDQVSKPDDGFTDPSDPQSWLLGRLNRIYSKPGNPELARSYRGHAGFIND